MIFSATVQITLRPGISDPAGSTIERSLPTLGFDGVSDVRVGKLVTFAVNAPDEAAAKAEVDDLCRRFLSNPVIEDASVSLEQAVDASA